MRKGILVLAFLIAMGKGHSRDLSGYQRSWENQLNEMNYLIMRASSVNIIHGLFLTRDQAEKLRFLAKSIDSLKPVIPGTGEKTFSELKQIKKTFLELILRLKYARPLTDSLRNRAIHRRMQESDIIKQSVVGAQRRGYKDKGCVKCHVSPRRFPKQDVAKLETRKVSAKRRREIDSAHVFGLFGDQVTYRFWELKSAVEQILTSGQRHLMKDFRCCLIPPKHLTDPTRVGQAFSTDEWIKYFVQVRELPNDQWVDFKPLYIVPIDDLIKATLPGIKSTDKQKILSEVDVILEDARKMDEIDFELQKKALCARLKRELQLDELTGEAKRQREDRQFMAAVFLLFPGSIEIYDHILGQKAADKN